MNPKTKKEMKLTYRFLSIAALFAAGALTIGCNSLKEQLNIPEEIPTPDKTVTLTATVGLDATTKALDATGKKTFAVGDKIAVIYKQGGGATALALSNPLIDTDIREEGQKADITVTLNNPATDGAVRYIYPASMALTTVDEADPIDDAHTIDFSKLNTQDGTLATLAANYDLAVFDGTLNGLELPGSALLSNQLAIGEFTVKNWSGTVITTDLTSFTVTDGTNTYTVSRAAADGPIYVAMLPVADTETLTFIATDNAATPNHFIKLVSGKALESNNMYPVRLTMYPALDIAELTGESYTVTDGYWLYGTQTSTLSLEIADDAHVTLAGVSINADGAYTDAHSGITCLGDATITLAGGTINTVRSFENEYSGIQAGPAETTLTINGTGTLNAYAYDAAAIGGSNSIDCGNITIEGGIILADCSGDGMVGTGIGAGNNKKCGNITISGGHVTAIAGSNDAAGIGTSGYHSTCGDILISGGTIIATGSNNGPGIGAGASYGKCGSITIGTGITSVTATRGCYTETGNSSSTDPCIGAVLPGAGSNICGIIKFGETRMTTSNKTDYPKTYLKWNPWPTSGSDYGGLHIVISNEERTWTLTPSNP